MGEIILKNAVKRRPGFLYFIDKDGSVCESKMVHGKKGTRKKKAAPKEKKK